jgi:single-strand DNA-binding protein
MNKVVLIGRLGAEPEMSYTAGGQSRTALRLATSRYLTGQDGAKREVTDWHDVIVWGKQAEATAQYTRKGAMVSVEGRLQTRSWEQDGQKRYRTEVVAENVQFLSRALESER